MQNRGLIIFISVLVSILCAFYLSFTFVARSVEKKADAFAQGSIAKKRQYLDSISNKEVYNLGFKAFTYQEVKDKALNLGLDLQGGMQLTLEISPVDIIKSLSGNSQDPNFLAALEEAQKMQASRQDKFTVLFYEAFKAKAGENKLNSIFSTADNRSKITFQSPDKDVMEFIDKEVDSAIQRAFEIIRTRIDKFGVSQPNITLLEGTNRIQVELPGADNPERVRKLLQGVAKLEFWEVYQAQEYQEFLMKINTYWVENKMPKTDTTRIAEATQGSGSTTTETSSDDLFVEGDSSKVAQNDSTSTDSAATAKADTTKTPTNVSPMLAKSASRYELLYASKDTAAVNAMLRDEGVKALLPSTVKFFWSVKPTFENSGEKFYTLYVIKAGMGGIAPLGGDKVIDASGDYDQFGKPYVSMTMNPEGAKIWQNLTRENVGKQIAIVLDDLVYSAPRVNEEIGGGRSSISGNFTIEEASDLANILKAGKLPAPTRIVEEAVVGPSLGKVAQNQGIISALVGLGLVVVFMVLYYAKAGLVANAALLFNLFFIFGLMTQFGTSLTLPGIAGIVLTMGMAVDANVLIFERIKEELRNGIRLTEAINLGFNRALITILDANITTFITAAFLLVFGSGGIKGFAVTLIIGILCSFFTAVFITRLFIAEITKKQGDNSNFKLETGISKNFLQNAHFDFMGKRKLFYGISGVFIAIGLGLIFTNGLNLGVDFKGGRSYVVQFEKEVSPTQIKSDLLKAIAASVEVKSYDGSDKVKITTNYKVEQEGSEVDIEVQNAVMTGLEAYKDLNPTIVSTAKVGATIADDIRDAASSAVIYSLIALFLYIWVRFKGWKFGLGAVISLFHDTLIVLSVFAITYALGLNLEVDQVFIAAILTVIGYSLNDTVVVFDRIRETLVGREDQNLATVFNKAINETLSRTIMTSSTTLIVILILLFFGGEVLRGFSLALFVGIVVGTYSSIFVATPLVLDFSGRKIKAEAEKAAAEKI
jgi:SecD/SecF fusion protein